MPRKKQPKGPGGLGAGAKHKQKTPTDVQGRQQIPASALNTLGGILNRLNTWALRYGVRIEGVSQTKQQRGRPKKEQAMAAGGAASSFA